MGNDSKTTVKTNPEHSARNDAEPTTPTEVNSQSVLEKLYGAKPVIIQLFDLPFIAQFNRSRIPSCVILDYRATQAAHLKDLTAGEDLAEIQSTSEAIEARREELEEELKGEGLDESALDEKISSTLEEEFGKKTLLRMMSLSAAMQVETPAMYKARTKLVLSGVTSWDIPGPDGNPLPATLDAMEAHGEIGTIIVNTLWEAYRPTTPVQAGDAATPNQNTQG